MRVQNQNGEFSIEIPMAYSHFYDKEGFLVGHNHDTYDITEPHFIKAIVEDTLISVETYKAKKKALKAVFDTEERNVVPVEIKRDGYIIYQVVTKTDTFYSVRQYLASNNSIYVLVAASRKGRTPAIDYFLNSLGFKPNIPQVLAPGSILISSLKAAPVTIKTKDIKPVEKLPVSTKANDEKDVNPFVLVNKPRPTYTDSARMNGVAGAVVLRVTFSENGFIPNFEIIKPLPEGLLRQAFFAALRMKFLPKEKGGKPISLVKIIEYHFAIY